MGKKRSKVQVDFTSETNLFAKTESAPMANAQPPTLPQRRGQELERATYDIPPELKTAVTQRATYLGIPASQLAIFLLSEGLRQLDGGVIDPAPFLTLSNSPKFRNNLEFGDWYYSGE